MSEISGNSYKWPEWLEMADIVSKRLDMFFQMDAVQPGIIV